MVRKWQTESIRRAVRSNYSKSISKTQQHTGSTLVSHSQHKKLFPRLESLKYWKFPATEHLKWTWLSQYLRHRRPAARQNGQSLVTATANCCLQQDSSHHVNPITSLLYIYFCFLIQLKSLQVIKKAGLADCISGDITQIIFVNKMAF